MPSSAPPPGRPGAAPRRGMGGLLGLLAVLAFVILAAVILTRRESGTIAEVPPASPVVPATTMPAPPPTEPPSFEPAAPVASAEPVAPAVETPAPAKAPRRSRRAPVTGGPHVADADPGRGRGPVGAPMGSSPRRFLLGTTSVESLKPVGRDLKGFEPGGVGVKRAPEVNGRLELEMDPSQVRPGVDYTVKVYLANDGDRDITVQEVKVATVENGKSASRTAPPRTRNVKRQQRVLVHEESGVWREAVRSWAMDVVVTSRSQDVYRNSLRWE